MKKFMLGFILAAVLFSALPVYAAVEQYILYKTDYKLYLAGQEYADKDYPALSYKGKIYVPLRTTIDAFNLNIDMSLNKVEVSKPSGEWVKVDDYNALFTDLPFIKSTSEGNVFTVQTASYIYNFKYEDGVWYVR